MNYWR